MMTKMIIGMDIYSYLCCLNVPFLGFYCPLRILGKPGDWGSPEENTYAGQYMAEINRFGEARRKG